MSWDHSWDSFPTQTGNRSPDLSQFLLPSSLSIFFPLFFKVVFISNSFWVHVSVIYLGNLYWSLIMFAHLCRVLWGNQNAATPNTCLWELCCLLGRGILSITPVVHLQNRTQGCPTMRWSSFRGFRGWEASMPREWERRIRKTLGRK